MSALEDEDLMTQNPAFQRLMELKNLYQLTKKSLGNLPKDSSKPTQAVSAPAPASSNHAIESLTSRKSKESNPDPAQIQTTIRSVIIKHGGSCHVDTVVEYVRMRWPNLRRRDGTPYSISDTKKTVQSNLRVPGGTRGMLLKDEEGNLILCDDDTSSTPKDAVSLTNQIAQAIEDGHSSVAAITAFVLKKWQRPKDVEEREIEEGISIVLKTNPKFKKDGRSHYINVGSPNKTRNGSKGKRPREDTDSDEDEQLKSESETTTTKRCGLKKEKKDTKKKEKEKEKEVDLNPWICCDRCHKWVRAKSDNIDDISLYDDNNPNHLDYYCPTCRAKGETSKDAKRPTSKRRGRGVQ